MSSMLILTNEGNLFCQGENLRMYIDDSIEPERLYTGFVDCTDVFPVDDQITDCAAAAFAAMVLTESGSCWMVGHDRERYGIADPDAESR